ncbi:hypothetical protein DL96DRAFT_1462419 [Flagelloscypha sp. PMI_526]|nr:hypothetical protein DL96DRAFT_1462419 [Flagelloscypha sp. PMI_526]
MSLQLVRSQHAHLLHAFMTLLRQPRTRVVMKEFISTLELCQCDRKADAFVDEAHDWEWRTVEACGDLYPAEFLCCEYTMEALIQAICRIFCKSIGIEKRGWGNLLSDVVGFPSNGAKTITQICRWLDEYPSFHTVDFLQRVVSYFKESQGTMSSAIFRSATMPSNIVALLNQVFDHLPDLSSPSESFKGYLHMILLVLHLVAIVTRTSDEVSIAYFYDDEVEPFLDIVSRLDNGFPQLKDSVQWTYMLITHAAAIYETLCLPLDPERYAPRILEGFLERRRLSWEFRRMIPYKTAQDILYALRRLNICGNRQCTSEAAGKWMQCGGCKRVLYCSKACQRQDWVDSLKPHKYTYDNLAILGIIAGFPDKARGKPLPRRFSSLKFKKVCLAKGMEESTVLDMNQYLMYDERIMKILHSSKL